MFLFFLFCGWVIMHVNVFASNLEFRVLAHYNWQGFWDGNMSPQKVFDKKTFFPQCPFVWVLSISH